MFLLSKQIVLSKPSLSVWCQTENQKDKAWYAVNDRYKINAHNYSPFLSFVLLFVSTRPATRAITDINSPPKYNIILLSKSLNKDAMTTPVVTYFEMSIR